MSSAQVTSQRGGLVEGRGQGSCLGSKLLCDCEGEGGGGVKGTEGGKRGFYDGNHLLGKVSSPEEDLCGRKSSGQSGLELSRLCACDHHLTYKQARNKTGELRYLTDHGCHGCGPPPAQFPSLPLPAAAEHLQVTVCSASQCSREGGGDGGGTIASSSRAKPARYASTASSSRCRASPGSSIRPASSESAFPQSTSASVRIWAPSPPSLTCQLDPIRSQIHK